MTYAAITGWGKCMPPAVLTNADLASLLDTSDEWITSRTGIKERRVSHATGIELSHVASARALACAGIKAREIELIVYGSCSNDETVPNSASGVQLRLGATRAASMDVNTACTSFMYALSTATAMIRTGVVRNALVIGVELISQFMDWSNRGVAILFGDGAAAVVLEATDNEEGLIAEKLGCDADVRGVLRVRGMGTTYAHHGVMLGDTSWNFDGQEIFKRAVVAMVNASQDVLARSGRTVAEIGLVIPHQANLRIIESMAKRVGAPMERVYLTVQRYGNMSSATIPVSLVEALEDGRVEAGQLILMPAFGAGLTWSSHLVRWGTRTTPLETSDLELRRPTQTALQRVRELIAIKQPPDRSDAGFAAARLAEDF
ncbi:MAG TPA: ketoacyl-ACP synthase III [Casimicrobiaceae bacterium]|nr:ketoacyl-ACP synthase III [Casimicrobiaceae bacterium]